MIQTVVAIILLIWAAIFLFNVLRKQFKTDKNCGQGCSCATDMNPLIPKHED
jgi:hypothetical protein